MELLNSNRFELGRLGILPRPFPALTHVVTIPRFIARYLAFCWAAYAIATNQVPVFTTLVQSSDYD